MTDALTRTKARLSEQGARNPGTTLYEGHPRVDIALVVAETERLRDLARATLLFFSPKPWQSEMAAEWERLMGPVPVTRENLCTAIHSTLGETE